MKCLVTGSEGFIGKNLVARLEQDGHEVVGFDPKISFGHGGEELINRKEKGDVLFHLGCINQMQATKFVVANLDVNALLTKSLAEYAAKNNMRFVYTSTASVYGNARHIPTPVEAFPNPLTDYAVAKLAGEGFVRNSGADYEIYRLSNVYGPHQTLDNPYCGVIGRFIQQALAGEPLPIIGDGQQTRDFSYVDDVVDVLIEGRHIIGGSRIMNVASGRETSVLRLASTIGRVLDEEITFKFVPERVIDGVQRRCLKSDFVLPTNLYRGIEKTVEWFKTR